MPDILWNILVMVGLLWIICRIATGTFTLLPKRWQGGRRG